MTQIRVRDQYEQIWVIQEGDPLWEEAKEAIKTEPEPVWPISKITENRGWGWWTVFKNLDDFETSLQEQVPQPSNNRLLSLDHEYTPTELQDLLQRYGSYLSTLHYIEGQLEAKSHALKEGLKTGLSVAMAQAENLVANTVAGKEAEIMAGNETFRNTRKLQITTEAQLLIVKGWREAYEQAWNTISRIISLRSSEATLQTGRHP